MLQASGNDVPSDPENDLLVVGKVASAYGLRGWVHVYSYTDPITNILDYKSWFIGKKDQWQQYVIEEGRAHGKGIVVRLQSFTDRDQAESLKGAEIAINKAKLPALEKDEFYWVELVGLEAVTLKGEKLGRVDSILETGANDVLMIKGEHEYLVPYVKNEFIKEVDLKKGVIIVDWDPEFSS